MLARQIERIMRARAIDGVVVATSTDPGDSAVAALCADMGVPCCRGALDDVLDRVHAACASVTPVPKHVVRLTGDCPLVDPAIVDAVVRFHLAGGFDYSSNTLEPTFPDGLDVEVMSYEVLSATWQEARLQSQREHVTPFIYAHPQRFRLGSFKAERDLSHLRWTVDTPTDFALITEIYQALYPAKPDFATNDILALLARRPELSQLNAATKRNEGLARSLRKEELLDRYRRSQELLTRATRTIPLGAQTFSKSTTQYPPGVSPHFIRRGQGSRVWDVDDNEYVDFVNALCAVNLGYNNGTVNDAVKQQLEEGVIFTLSHPIEAQAAEMIVEMIPCAEMVRFGKNGSDATAGAIRVARAYTGRDRVAVCGYHGWQDWYIGSTPRHRGVPQATRELTHSFAYNDLGTLAAHFSKHPGEFAAVIIEPMNVTEPRAGFLSELKQLTHSEGALLIFDETITGFRYAQGGAQELFGVAPDLATLGKGMANGFPISAVVGRAEFMRLMEEVFFSFTFGGEALSLAAACATMGLIQSQPVIDSMYSQGHKIITGTRSLIAEHGLTDVLTITGNPTWSFLLFRDHGGYSQWAIKTLFLQEVFARGILTLGTHNMSYAHNDEDVQKLLAVYDEVFGILEEALRNSKLDQYLLTRPLEPLFKVR